jgi:hypothetical protein
MAQLLRRLLLVLLLLLLLKQKLAQPLLPGLPRHVQLA